jgi:hypothetical protein
MSSSSKSSTGYEVPIIHGKGGVREARTLSRSHETYNISEVTTARAHAIRDLRMAVQRARTLEGILGHWLAACDGDLDLAKSTLPWNLTRVEQSEIVRMIPRCGWAWAVEHWFSGGLERSIQDTLPNLPQSVRDELEKKHGIY